MNPTKVRLQRKLSIIKVLSKNPGITLDQLAKFTNRTRQEITKDLGELFMVGAYPYTPADYIEIDFDGNNLNLNLPVSLEKSIGLNPLEWLELRNLIDKEIEEIKKKEELEVLNSIKEKIKAIVPYAEYKNYEKIREEISRAIKEKLKIEFYYSGRKDEIPEKREVDPWILFQEKNEYLAAYCHTRKGIRTFRLETINNLKVTEEKIQVYPDKKDVEKHLNSFKAFLQQSADESEEAEVLILKSAYFNFSSQVEIKIIDEKFIYREKEYIKANTKIIHRGWFLGILKSFGNSVILISPEGLKKELLKEINNIRIPDLI